MVPVLLSCTQGLGSHTYIIRASSIVIPLQGLGAILPGAVSGESQGQLFFSCDPHGQIFCLSQVFMGGGVRRASSSAHAATCQIRDSSPLLTTLGLGHSYLQISASSAVLSRWGSGPVFLSVATSSIAGSKGQGVRGLLSPTRWLGDEDSFPMFTTLGLTHSHLC